MKNHELYFERIGGKGGKPSGKINGLIEKAYGSFDAWKADMKATAVAARGWVWTAYDWDAGQVFNFIGDEQNTYPMWNCGLLVALDCFEHAYFIDYGTGKASYIDKFFDNLDWDVVAKRAEMLGILSSPVATGPRAARVRTHPGPRRIWGVQRRAARGGGSSACTRSGASRWRYRSQNTAPNARRTWSSSRRTSVGEIVVYECPECGYQEETRVEREDGDARRPQPEDVLEFLDDTDDDADESRPTPTKPE